MEKMEYEKMQVSEQYQQFFDIPRLVQAAEAGNGKAALQLAEGYYCYNKNYDLCFHYLQLITDAEVKDPEIVDAANYRMAYLYARGKGVQQDIDKAIELFSSVQADELQTTGLCNIGVLKLAKRDMLFLEEWKQAEQLGCYAASAYIAMYLSQTMPVKDMLKEGAEHEDTTTLAALATLYTLGAMDIPKDEEKAYPLFLKAAENGNVYALYSVAMGVAFQKNQITDIEELKLLEDQARYYGLPKQYSYSVFLLNSLHMLNTSDPLFDHAWEVLADLADEGFRPARFAIMPILLAMDDSEANATGYEYLDELEQCREVAEINSAMGAGIILFSGNGRVKRNWKLAYRIFSVILKNMTEQQMANIPNGTIKNMMEQYLVTIRKYKRIIEFFHPTYKRTVQ